MKLKDQNRIVMLESISWPTYLVSIFIITLIYYGWVFLIFYRTELAGIFKKKHIQNAPGANPPTDQQFVVIGQTAHEDEAVAGDQELQFGPADADEPTITTLTVPSAPQQVGEFSEMVGEVKTLIRVVAESSESRENFEMLFGLIIQKYPGLSATPYRNKIIGFLLAESQDNFPFALSEEALNQLWNEHSNN
jgi:cytoskeletal protein RodZ